MWSVETARLQINPVPKSLMQIGTLSTNLLAMQALNLYRLLIAEAACGISIDSIF